MYAERGTFKSGLLCLLRKGFDVGNRPGTYESCGLSSRLDSIVISKSLQHFFIGGGLFRKGSWSTHPDDWETYPEMTISVEQASDHAAVFIDLDI